MYSLHRGTERLSVVLVKKCNLTSLKAETFGQVYYGCAKNVLFIGRPGTTPLLIPQRSHRDSMGFPSNQSAAEVGVDSPLWKPLEVVCLLLIDIDV